MRYHRGKDGWGRDGYEIPNFAVAGSSHTGEDGPAPTATVREELERCQAALKAAGITSRMARSRSGNCCNQKVWLTVARKDFKRATTLAKEWLKEHEADTRLIHDAD